MFSELFTNAWVAIFESTNNKGNNETKRLVDKFKLSDDS